MKPATLEELESMCRTASGDFSYVCWTGERYTMVNHRSERMFEFATYADEAFELYA